MGVRIMSHRPRVPVKPPPDGPAPDWGAAAVRAAEYVRHRLFFARGGAFLWSPGVVAHFGNDSRPSDGRAQAEVEALRRCLPGAGARELGFGGSDGSWALLV